MREKWSAFVEKAWVRDGLAVGLLLLLVALFMGPALLPGRVLLPLDIVTQGWPPWQRPNQPVAVHNWLLTDVVNYILPVKLFMVESIRRGEFPLWNPYVLTGYPFTYNTQAGLFYPLSAFYHGLPWASAVDATIGTQLALGAIFMFAYLRVLALRRLAALAGGVLFAFNGLMMVWLEWQVVHAAIIWLPLQLLLAEKMVQALSGGRVQPGRAVTYALLGGLALAIPWLGGHWNWTLYTSMTLAVYLLWRIWPLLRAADWPGRGRLAALGLLFLGSGVALSLVQVWPAFTYLSQTHRRPLPFADSLLSGLWDRAVVLLVPNFFGNPSHNNNWWGIDNYNETTLYLGLLPLFLIGLALLLRRDRLTWFYAGWGLLGLLWTLGTPAYGLLYVLPVFSGLYPGRAAILVVVCGAVLSAISLDRLMGGGWPRPGRLVRAVAAIAGVSLLVVLGYSLAYRADVARTADYLLPWFGWALLSLLVSAGLILARLRGWLRPRPFGALALAWLVADLYLMSYGYNTISPVSDFYPESPIVDFLQSDPEPFRIATPAEGIVFYPNTSLLARIGNASGYEPGLPRRHVDLYNAAEGESAIRFNRILMPLKGLDSPLMDMLNVKYITTIADWWQANSVPDVAQTRVDGWLPLTADSPAGQRFVAGDAGLHRVDLPLRLENAPAGTVTARIFTGDGGLELAHADLDLAGLPAEGWHSFYFAAFPSEWGREFRLVVTYDGHGAVAVGQAHEDVYPAGTRLAGDSPAGDDLAFATYYLPRPELAFEEGKTRIYVNEGYLPRAYAVHEAIVAGDEAAALAAVVAHAAELGQLVVLEASDGAVPPTVTPAGGASVVTVTANRLNRVTLQAEMAAPGYVVLADSYYPGWQATVDGQATPVFQANYLLRAVYVPAGVHTIEFQFRPPDFFLGGLVSGVTLLLVLGVLAVTVVRRRRGAA